MKSLRAAAPSLLSGRSVVALLIAVGFAGCGTPESSLDGSISTGFSLEFDEVRLTKQGCLLEIDYIKTTYLGVETPCRVVIDTTLASPAVGSAIQGDTFLAAVTVTRLMPAATLFPPVTSGKLSFDRFNFTAGAKLSGSFSVRFADGRNLDGRFLALLAEPDPTDVCVPPTP